MEFEDVSRISPEKNDAGEVRSLYDWFHAHLLDQKNAGIDINSETPPHGKLGWGCVIGTLTFCLVAAIVVSLMVVGIQALFGR